VPTAVEGGEADGAEEDNPPEELPKWRQIVHSTASALANAKEKITEEL
jgi:hypothetical protein